MAAMVIDNVDDNAKDAKSALRDALRAKLKSTASFEETTTTNTASNAEESSMKLIDVETIGNDSDDSDGESDEKIEEKESSTSTIPIEERRLRNRLAARKCREKRKQRINNLEKVRFTKTKFTFSSNVYQQYILLFLLFLLLCL